MSKEVDLLIIGAGMAGLTAAETAGGRELQVKVIASGYGCSQASSGTIDVLGQYANKKVVDLEETLGGFIERNPCHVYAVAGRETVLSVLSDFQRRSDGLYVGKDGQNMEVITPLGTCKTTYLIQFTMRNASFNLLSEGKSLVVAVPGLLGYAPHIIKGKMEEKGINVKMAKLKLAVTSPFQLATYLEANPETLISELKEANASSYDWVILPPILGITNVKKVWQIVEESLKTNIVELPSFPPSVPGKRLHILLKRRCEEKGVSVVLGEVAKEVKIKERRVKEVLTSKGRYSPRALVLSTGWALTNVLKIKGVSPVQKTKGKSHMVRHEYIENLFFAISPVSYEEKAGLGAAMIAGYLAGKAAVDYLGGGR
ncbi:MAG: FAD-binding protein [Candidatus Jordarchaeales archaeon]